MSYTNHDPITQSRMANQGELTSPQAPEYNAPFTATFVADCQKGCIYSVSQTIFDVTGYTAQHFQQAGISAFLSIIHPGDCRTLFRMVVSLPKSGFCNSVSAGSIGLRIKHLQGHWILVDLVVQMLDLGADGRIREIAGTLKASADFDWFGSSTESSSSHLTYRAGHYQKVKVSKREFQVLQLIAYGNSSKMIADKLFISVHTAARHRSNLLEKFSAKNTAELIWTASKQYWL